MKLDFLIFRHGETDWNKELRFQGHSDIALNETGRLQASELAEKLKPLGIKLIACSDLSRAKETAQIVVSRSPAKIIYSDQLREAHLGQTEGITRDEVIARFGKISWDRWRSAKPEDMEFGWPGGETKRNQLTRMKNYMKVFVNTYVKEAKDPIGISTHGGVLARLVLHSINSPNDVQIPNCVVYHLVYDLNKDEWHYKDRL